MKGPLKWVAAVLGVIVLLFVGAAILLPLLIDPNDHKQALIAQVKERTGRDLAIDGDIELTVFPWIGVQVGKVALSNAAGFDNPVFASTDKVSIRVKLLPLFSKRLEMDTVTVHGLKLNLARDARGRSNWDDLVKASGDTGEAGGSGTAGGSGGSGGSGGKAAAALAIGGLDIDDANLSWVDASKNQHFKIDNLSLQTGPIAAGEPVDLKLALDVALGEPALSGHVSAEGRLDYDQAKQLARVKALEIIGDFSGETLPGGKARLRLAADAAHDGARKSLLVENLEFDAEDLKLTGQLRVSNIDSSPAADGRIEIAEFNPKELLAAVSKEPLQTRDPKALTRASLQATIGGKPNQLVVKPLTVRLDDSTINGEVSLVDIKAQALRFALVLDAIDVDRYLPPEKDAGASGAASSAPVAATPGSAAGSASKVPNDTLRGLDIIGTMKIGKLKVAKLNLADVQAALKAKDGVIRINPFDANLYNGTYRGDITVDARGESPRITLDEKLAGVQAGPLLKDLQGQDRITGAANVNIAMQTTGATADEVKKSLTGNASFAFTDGAVNGVNIARMIREANARIKGTPLPVEEVEQKTDFSEIRGTLQVDKGMATNNDFTAMTPLLRINGKGTANLPSEIVDYRIKATVVKTLEGQGGEELKDLVGIPIPIHVTGSFNQPKYALDTEELVKAVGKSKIDKTIDEKIGDDRVKGLLKGLIK
jgi:AsmA protein